MKKQRLIKNITDQIKEAQMKLGFVRESIRLYFPWDSFMVLLGETLEEEGSGIHSEDKLFPNDGNCSETERKKQKRRILNELNGSAGFGTGGLGQVSFRESLSDEQILREFEKAQKNTCPLPIKPPPADEFERICGWRQNAGKCLPLRNGLNGNGWPL